VKVVVPVKKPVRTNALPCLPKKLPPNCYDPQGVLPGTKVATSAMRRVCRARGGRCAHRTAERHYRCRDTDEKYRLAVEDANRGQDVDAHDRDARRVVFVESPKRLAQGGRVGDGPMTRIGSEDRDF
jgi:hypothetical protein